MNALVWRGVSGGTEGTFRFLVVGGMVRAHMDTGRTKASEAMAQYGSGDERAFDTLYDELAPKLAGYLRRSVRDASAVDDLLQQVFLQIHRSRGRFVPGSRVEPWAYAIARAVAVDWLRRGYRRRTDELPDEVMADDVAADPLSGSAAGEIGAALQAELEGLSPKLREAFLLVRIDGLTHAEAAEVLGIEESATKVRAHRATVWLREKLSRFRDREGAE